ncbi:hypothetical protein AOLI_G00159710 [Acnodon oligacanthus]
MSVGKEHNKTPTKGSGKTKNLFLLSPYRQTRVVRSLAARSSISRDPTGYGNTGDPAEAPRAAQRARSRAQASDEAVGLCSGTSVEEESRSRAAGGRGCCWGREEHGEGLFHTPSSARDGRLKRV